MWKPLLLVLVGSLPGSTVTGSPASGLSRARELVLQDQAALHEEIARIASEHAAVATALSLGISREGRVIEGLVLSGRDEPAKPALLLVANLDGPDVFSSAIALDHARRLAEGYGSDAAVTALLDSTRVYVVPRADPDAAEARFLAPLEERRTSGRGVDDDRDGRFGEDPPADVDGDGQILAMRVPDPEGKWMEDPADPRAHVEAQRAKGERGRFRIEVEGHDADGDERVAEDREHDTVLNHNFPAGWEEHAPDAGLFPSDEPGARALMELVLTHPEIALVLCYAAPGNLVVTPKSVKDETPAGERVPPSGILASDAALLAELGRRYRELTANEAEGEGDDAGTFQRWCYEHRGLLALSTVLWEMPEEWKEGAADGDAEAGTDTDSSGAADDADDAGVEGDAAPPEEEAAPSNESTEDSANAKGVEDDEPEPSLDAKRLKWVDGSGESERFVDWRPFEHPTLGPVSIGGFAPYALVEPPRAQWTALADVHFAFLLALGECLPRVQIAECEAVQLGPELWRIRAVVAVDGLLPLLTRAARRAETVRPAKLALVLGAATLVAGPRHVLIEDLPGSGGRSETTWLVETADPTALEVTVETSHAGRASARPVQAKR